MRILTEAQAAALLAFMNAFDLRPSSMVPLLREAGVGDPSAALKDALLGPEPAATSRTEL